MAAPATKRRPYNKYGNRKITRDGVTFDSAKEARRYIEKVGAIQGLERQVAFELIPAQYEEVHTGEYYKRGDRKGEPKMKRICIEKAVTYYSDFVYFEGGEKIVEDAKGFKTPEYILKRKLMLYIHKIKIREV